jgi:hypothetical protein
LQYARENVSGRSVINGWLVSLAAGGLLAVTGCGSSSDSGFAPAGTQTSPSETLEAGSPVSVGGGTRARADSDITRAAPPGPTGAARRVAPASARSLFRSRNLTRVLRAVEARLGGRIDVVQAAIYPGALELVIANNDNKAQRVSTGVSGRLRAGPRAAFDGGRSAIELDQILPRVPERLARLIAGRGGVRLSGLDHFALTTSVGHGLAGYEIYPKHGDVFFTSLLTGSRLERVTPKGKRRLSR